MRNFSYVYQVSSVFTFTLINVFLHILQQCGVHKLLQDQNLIDGSGNLDTDAMKHNTQGFEESWKQTSQQTIDYCVQRTEETVAEIEQRGGPKGDCKPTAAMFVMCVGKVTMKQCPADKWNSCRL